MAEVVALADAESVAVADADRDALHILPLAILPLRTAALRRARLVKNARLNAVVEFFGDAQSGSGQMEIRSLPKEFGWPDMPPHPDFTLMRKLAALPSFDVYSLRILLRAHEIAVKDQSALRLSPAKVKELTAYMTTFTRPLIREIYGEADLSIESFDDVVGLFRSPDMKKVRERLQTMADKLGIGIAEIPKFLEDYGDIFLSLSYYRQCLDAIVPAIEDFLGSLNELRKSYQMRHDANLMKTCVYMESTINELLANITGRFENFDRSTNDMWRNLSADRFRKVEALIRSYHTSIGGILCALSVKMNAWAKLFPDASAGGPVRRAEFIMSEMRQGIDRIQKIEDSAPMLSAVG
jgi:hypothetical protein